MSVAMAVSQPSLCLLPLQSAKPVLHCPLHAPLPHALAMFWAEQTVPHAPQLLTSPAMLISQPSLCLLPLQSAKPVLHVPLQTPPLQLVAMLLFEHAVEQPPQLLISVFVLISHPSLRLFELQSA
jgi:hypothetical protein